MTKINSARRCRRASCLPMKEPLWTDKDAGTLGWIVRLAAWQNHVEWKISIAMLRGDLANAIGWASR